MEFLRNTAEDTYGTIKDIKDSLGEEHSIEVFESITEGLLARIVKDYLGEFLHAVHTYISEAQYEFDNILQHLKEELDETREEVAELEHEIEHLSNLNEEILEEKQAIEDEYETWKLELSERVGFI